MIHSPLMHFKPSMKKASFEVALKGKEQIAKGTYAFVFEKPKEISFRAGQHIRITLINPPETDSGGNSRFLSLASTPQEKDLVIAMRMRDSAFKRVLGRMQIGDKVKIEMRLDNPHGSFTLHDDPSIPAVFITGGIGIVPAFSMIKDATERKLPHKIFLFYSNRKPEDASYLDDLKVFEKQNPNFKLIATMTEPEKSTLVWKGETGFIDKTMLNRYIDDLQTPIYYIAGLTGMVNAMKKLLNEVGVSEDNIKAEDFSSFKMGFMNNIAENLKNHSLLLLIMGVVSIVILGHGIAAAALLNNPISYLIGGLLLLIVAPFKLKHLLGLRNHNKK